jgi:GNAT superfamily N-acetyltransferase
MSVPLPGPERLERIEAVTFADEYLAAPPDVVRQAGLGHEWIGDTLVAWASAIDMPMFNRALGIGQGAPATRETIDSIAGRFDRHGVSRAFIQVAPGASPTDLLDWLPPLGYSPYNRWAKFARPLTDLPPLSTEVRIDRIGPDRADDFARVLVEAFQMPPIMGAWEAAVVGRPRWSHYVAYQDGAPVGCAATFVDDGLVSLGQAGTLPSARGRGVQGALIARRLVDAAQAGCTHAVVETAEDTPQKPAPSYRNQLRYGFELCYFRVNHLRARPPAR